MSVPNPKLYPLFGTSDTVRSVSSAESIYRLQFFFCLYDEPTTNFTRM